MNSSALGRIQRSAHSGAVLHFGNLRVDRVERIE
jgi:hypothetical protein